MVRWEYTKDCNCNFEDMWNEHGAMGWELVSVTNSFGYFKRKKRRFWNRKRLYDAYDGCLDFGGE